MGTKFAHLILPNGFFVALFAANYSQISRFITAGVK